MDPQGKDQLVVNRRTFVRITAAMAGVAAAGSLGTGVAAATSAPPNRGALAGTVVAASAVGLTIISHGTTSRITTAVGAQLYAGRAGNVTAPSAFIPGDFVVAEGVYESKVLMADRVGSVLGSYSCIVDEVKSDGLLKSSTGALVDWCHLNLPGMPEEKTNETPRAGVGISGLSWTDPSSHVVYLYPRAA